MAPSTVREVGRFGVVVTVLAVVVNVVHPFDGDTRKYGDVLEFVADMDTLWVIDHLFAALVFLPVPWVLWTWVRTFETERAQWWGTFGSIVATVGVTIGAVHLAGIDGVALPAFGDLVRDQGISPEIAGAGAALLKVHLMTFTSWTLVAFFAAPLILGAASLMDRETPRTLAAVWLVASVLAAASVVVTALEGQLTTLSEPGLFRPSTVLYTIALFWVSLRMMKTDNTQESEQSIPT